MYQCWPEALRPKYYVYKWKTDLGGWSKLFLVILVLSNTSLIGLGIWNLVSMNSNASHEQLRLEINITLLLFSFALFQGIHAVYGIFFDNLYEIVATMGAKFFITGYVIAHFLFSFVVTDKHRPQMWDYTLAITVVLFQLIYLLFIKPLHSEYSWRLYRRVGSDKGLRRMHTTLLKFQTLIKFDFMFMFITILISGDGIFSFYDSSNSILIVMDILWFFLAIATIVIGWIAFKYEKRYLVVVFYFLCPISPAYITFLFLEDFILQDASNIEILQSIIFLGSSAIALLMRIILMIFGGLVYRSFGEGLTKINTEPDQPISAAIDNRTTYDIYYEEVDDHGNSIASSLTYEDVMRNTYADLVRGGK
eukprot:TRINITY_DN2761_c0_g1_i1.p1 TRINITY_DN2761_c0_g1~~TRINITY_DN2761_c0_g1_i1.p1  ORF type:complete len:364 (-),score=19.91 TRINITY_DN2761_c0_g1_i1:41-1132(-)